MDLAEFAENQKAITINGKDYIFSEFTVGDIAEARNHALQKKKKETRQIFEDYDRKELVKIINDVKMTEQEYDEYFETLEGMLILLYYSLKHKQPDITVKEVNNLFSIGDAASLAKLEEIVTFAAGGTSDNKESEKPDTDEGDTEKKRKSTTAQQ